MIVALEGFTESLSYEIHPAWNIKVCTVTPVRPHHRSRIHLQITSVEPGAFKSDILSAMQIAPQHPAYADPSLPVVIARQSFETGPTAGDFVEKFGLADTAAGVQKIYELTELPDPPLRLPLSLDAVARIRDWGLGLVENTNKYASWSDSIASGK